MEKLIRIFERTQPIYFLSPQNEYNLYRTSFLSFELVMWDHAYSGENLKDDKIVSRIRTELWVRFDLEECQL